MYTSYVFTWDSCRHGTGARLVVGACFHDEECTRLVQFAKRQTIHYYAHDMCPSRVTAGANNTRSQFRDRFSCTAGTSLSTHTSILQYTYV